MSMYLRFDPGLRALLSDDELINEVLREYPDARDELESLDVLDDDEDDLYDAFIEASELDEETPLFDAA